MLVPELVSRGVGTGPKVEGTGSILSRNERIKSSRRNLTKSKLTDFGGTIR